MHELSLREAVREQALAAAHAEGASRIEVISLLVGELAGVDPEALRFAFPVVMEGTIAAGAQLQIESEPAVCRCGGCGADYRVCQGVCDCPHCGSLGGRLLSGRDLRLLALEVG
ncbi:MAG: hydrogenase maturation nickel metallochaperone HypA [Cyanobium sp.]